MVDYSILPRHNVICIDIKSFYASCECIFRGLDPRKAKLAVVGDINRNGSVVLASSPEMKRLYKIKTGSRLFEIKRISDPEIIIAQSRMKSYLEISRKIVEIFESFVPPNQIHTYSVDESWITLNGTEKLWGDPWEATEKIIQKIEKEIGVIATAGIGDNKFLAKIALDNYGKEAGIAEIRYEDVPKKLHPLYVGNIWGIGKQMTSHFNDMGIFKMRDLAHSDLDLLKQIFGVNGEKLFWHAWGVDRSPVIYDKDNLPQSAFGFSNPHYKQEAKSIGRGVTLLKDYKTSESIKLVIREIIEEVCYEMRKKQVEGKTIHLSIGYTKKAKKDGFSRQKTIVKHTNDVEDIMNVCYELFDKFYDNQTAVRQVRVSVGKLNAEEREEKTNHKNEKKKKLYEAADTINEKFGKGTIVKASALRSDSVVKERSKKIGGHFE